MPIGPFLKDKWKDSNRAGEASQPKKASESRYRVKKQEVKKRNTKEREKEEESLWGAQHIAVGVVINYCLLPHPRLFVVVVYWKKPPIAGAP